MNDVTIKITLVICFLISAILAIYWYFKFKIEKGRADQFNYDFLSKRYKRDALFEQIEKDRQSRHYYKQARFGEAYGLQGSLNDLVKTLDEIEAQDIEALRMQVKRWSFNPEPIFQKILKRRSYQTAPEYTATPSEFHVLKMKLLKRMIDLNLINDNQEGEASFRMPYAKEQISLVVKDDPSGNVSVFADGAQLKPSQSNIILSFLERTKNHDFTK